MGPKKGKKKGRNDDDQQFAANEEKVLSKWAQALEEKDEEEEPNAQQLYVKPSKAVFEFDFSNQRALDLAEPVQKPQRDKYADYTEEELAQVRRLKQKSKVDKEVKNQIKNEKKKERKKEIEAQKLIEQIQKQKQVLENKKVEEQIKKIKKSDGNPWVIPGGLLIFLIFMLFLQYNQEIHEKLSKFQKSEDFYQILEADQSTTDKELKNKYKKLVMKYHPDRNPDCENCKEKFDGIMKAWQVLGDPEKRKQYDKNSGFIGELKSASTTLTPHNFQYEVQESRSLWMIQVLDSTNSYCMYFTQFWEEMVTNYGDFVKFGRIDIWHQSQMSSYIPYKFQVFPSVYFVDQGYTEICSFNYERPTEGLKKCLEQALSKKEQTIVKQIPQKSTDKLSVYLDGKLRANIRIKAYNKQMQKYFKIYYLQEQSPKKQATVLSNSMRYHFNFTQNSKTVFYNYFLFLQSFVVQEISTCAFLQFCEENECVLVLNRNKTEKVMGLLPFETQGGKKLPVFVLTDGQDQLDRQIGLIKESFENFDVGVYIGGRIDLGYANQVGMLKPDHGERLELQCKVLNWKQKIAQFLDKIVQYFTSNPS